MYAERVHYESSSSDIASSAEAEIPEDTESIIKAFSSREIFKDIECNN